MRFDKFRNGPWPSRLAKAVAAVLTLWAVAWAVVPGLVKSQLEELASTRLGRKVSVASVGFRPWSMELSLNNLQIADAAGTAPQLQLAYFHADVELQSLLRLAPVVDEVRLEGLQLRLTHRGDGHYDVDDMLERLASASQGQPEAPAARFALYNVAVSGASLDFVDEKVGRTHQVRDLTLTIPFLSNLESKRDVLVEPRLAFDLDGSTFDSAAQATPFAPSHKSSVAIDLRNLDLRPYLPYLPRNLPLRLQTGVLEASVRLAFEQTDKPSLKLSGTVDLKDVHLADARGRELLAWHALHVAMDDVRPLERAVRLTEVDLAGPRLDLRRAADGRLEVMGLAGGAPVAPDKGGPAKGTAADAASPWRVEVGKAAVRAGHVRWFDASTRPDAQLEMQELAMTATGFGWPWQKPARFDGAFKVAETPTRGRKAVAAPAARLGFKGQASGEELQATAEMQDVSLGLAAPYLAQFLEPSLAGRLDARLSLQRKGADWQIGVQNLALSDLRLGAQDGADRNWPVAVQRLELQDGAVDLSRRSVTLGRLAVTQPSLSLERGADKRWMFERWLKPAGAGSTPAPATGSEGGAWRVAVKEFALDGGSLRYADRATVRPVSLTVAPWSLQLSNLATDGGKPAGFRLAARVRSRYGDPGQLGMNGSLALQPLAVQGRLQASRVPLQALSPYLGDVLNVALLRADAGFQGDIRYRDDPAGPVLQLAGNALLEDVAANSLLTDDPAARDMPIGQELLSWKAVSLSGLDLSLAPGQATRVAVAETALTDFYARVIIDPSGRINLQDVVKRAAPAAPPPSAAAPASQPTPAVASAPAPATEVRMGPISLVNGRIDFSDRFIKPNYSADLTGLTGRLGAFSSAAAGDGGPPALADLELRGRAEGTASIEITGKLNPLAQPLALDIQGRMRDLELPPLSPYSVKYAGHGIERGKLAMDVNYQIKPDGQLVASNRLVLHQLNFGDKVEGAPASLPVRLAVALLADRNGVIDIDLPISGSINDPEFSLGSIIFKMVLNLIGKAITSPFSLLASAFGGGEEAAEVTFAPGSALLDAPARSKLDKIAAMMKERPGLLMTVVGEARLDAEREGFRRERLNDMMQAEKRRAAVVAGKPADGQAAFAAAERPALLKQVYRRARIPKPRNLIGLLKDLPEPEMEALLMASVPVGEEQMRELAQARGLAVKDYLLSRELPPDRLFLGSSRLVPADAKPDEKWAPRAELQLALP